MSEQDDLLRELVAVRAEEVVLSAIGGLVNVATVRLGLVPQAPEARDLVQARIAIDAVGALIGVIEPSLPPQGRQELQETLASLRMAYAQQAPPGAAQPAEPREPPEPPKPKRPGIWTPRGEV
jgi:hypothetical protein